MADLRWPNYWEERGKRYEADFVHGPLFKQQEQALLAVLGELEYDSVLEAGCGFGRITSLVMESRPSLYTAIDVSPEMLASASARIPMVDFAQSTILNYKPGRQWDLVLAVEVLMHVPPTDIAASVAHLRALAERHLVTVDYVGDRKLAAHNWKHDYATLMPGSRAVQIGDQAIRIWSR